MRLNPDCLRGVLLTVEEMCDGRTEYTGDGDDVVQGFIDDHAELRPYDMEEVDYHFLQCIFNNVWSVLDVR